MGPVSLEKIVALCKRRGFIFPTAEIYGGLNGVYDVGPLGVMLKNNIKHAWSHSLKLFSSDIVFMEGALLGSEAMWKASGHIDNFHDPLVDCLVCKHRFRADDINVEKPCPQCGNKQWTAIRQFNMMFKTALGASSEQATNAYLRPETAQAIFVNFKNILSSYRIKIPFGIAQMGKAFRNEITPKQFLFRMREFEQMEIEWFCKEETALDFFEQWRLNRQQFYLDIGIKSSSIRIRDYEKTELAHYSKETCDIEYEFPFGWKELEGIAYRSDFDLSQHMKFSGKDLSVYDESTKTSFIPHVVECSVGIDRLFLTILCNSYIEEHTDDDIRIVLKIHPSMAPIKAAFFPLTKSQHESMEKIYHTFKNTYSIQFDASGSIGKRYRRQDEIGTPFCFTYDFESEQTQTVTIRDRDTMNQKRIPIHEIESYLLETSQAQRKKVLTDEFQLV